MIKIVHIRSALWGLQSSGFSENLRRAAKSTPGLAWDPTTRTWCGYADAVEACAARLRAVTQVQGQAGTVVTGITTMPVAYTGLRDYQKVGVDFLIAKASEGCILSDDLGLGKTLTAITAARAFKEKTVVVCPSFVRGVWLDKELPKWWPAARVAQNITGTKPHPIDIGLDKPIDVIVIHYDILYAWVDALIAWGARTLIVDEGHYTMSATSRRTKAVVELAKACKYRIMLSGTPMTSRPRDLWAPVNTISEGRFGAKFFLFGLKHCAGHQEQIDIHVEGVKAQKVIWKFDGSSNLDELNRRMVYSKETPWGFMLRRLKSEVALQLPARIHQVISVDVPRTNVSPLHDAVKSDKLLRQALNNAADGKFPHVVEMALNHLEQGVKIVIGTYRRAIAESIAGAVRQKYQGHVEIITGDTPTAKRNAIVKAEPDLICCTLDSTCVGINMSYASVAIVAELVWVPSTINQWVGRFGRYEGANILVQFVIARGTADDLVKRALRLKSETFTEVIGKTDDKLADDLKQLEGGGAMARMAALYKRMKEADDE